MVSVPDQCKQCSAKGQVAVNKDVLAWAAGQDSIVRQAHCLGRQTFTTCIRDARQHLLVLRTYAEDHINMIPKLSEANVTVATSRQTGTVPCARVRVQRMSTNLVMI